MYYDPKKKAATLPMADIETAGLLMLYAIKKIRLTGGISLEGNTQNSKGPMTDFNYAEQAIIDAALKLGINLGETRYGLIDVRDAG